MKKSIIARILSPLALLALAAFVFIQVPSVHAQTITSTPCYQFVTNLTIGSTGADVVALQKLLISKGFSLPSIQAGFAQYGYFGVETQSAVKKYQTSVGIESTGFVGPLTRASLSACSGGQETVVTPLTIEGVTLLTRTDRAGQLSEFRPGNGLNWNFRITINSPTESELDNLFLFGPTGGIWSTGGMYLGSQTWPIVIYRDGVQMNTSYSSDMNIPIRRGVNVFDLFVRSDTETWPIGTAAELAVRLSSGTKSILLPEYGTTTTPTIALKVNDSSGSVTVIPLSNLNFAWTSVNTDRCYNTSQVSGWNSYDSRPINGAVSINAPASAGTFVYSLTCLKANPYPMDNSYATSTVTVNVVATTSTPSITVLSPNGGETWTIGSTQDIRWSSKNFASSEKIEIRLISNEYLGTTDLISGTLNDGQESIIVPNVAPGTKYGIQIYSKNNASVVDTGDFHFTITAPTTTPSITVLSPNGGESYKNGQQIQINWRSTGFTSQKLNIALMFEANPGEIGEMIANGIQNTGTYTWTVKSKEPFFDSESNRVIYPNGKYWISISCNYGDVGCPSPNFWKSGTFTITSSNTTNLPPVITSVAGKAAGNFEIDAGGTVGIQGTNLLGYKDSTNVYIGGMTCTITQLSNTLIYCTAPSNLTVGSTYDLYINTSSMGGDKVTSNIVRVKVLSKLSTNRPPAINGITAPTVLKVNETGTWTIKASDPENGSLSYSIDWGEAVCPTGYVCTASSGSSFSQTSSFTHSYASPGIYTVKVTVTDAAGLKAQTSSTVRVDAIPMPLRTINVTSPTTGSVFDNGSSQNVIAGWQADTGDFDSYNVSIGNSGANVEKLISTGISKFSNGFSTTAGTLKDAISSVSGKVAPESGYYFVITAIKNDAAGGGIVARGNGASFKIVTPTTVVCPVGYICTPAGQPTACPAGSTCAPTTLSCPSGYTCYTKTLTTPTVTATTPYITIVSPRYENLKIGVKHQIKWKDSREKGKGLSPVYTIMIAGSNGKELVVENLATSKWCDDIQCYYDWTPTTASTNNQISIYDIANDPNQALVGRSTIFNIEAGSPVSQKTIKLNASIWEAVKSYFKGTR